jgi:hypothetical protein
VVKPPKVFWVAFSRNHIGVPQPAADVAHPTNDGVMLSHHFIPQMFKSAIRFFGLALISAQEEFLGGEAALFVENLAEGAMIAPLVDANAAAIR